MSTKRERSSTKAGKGRSAQRRTALARGAGETDWRLETLARVRQIIERALPSVVEERKWRKPSNGMAGVAVWSCEGMICTGEMYKGVVKLTFAKGASVPDPAGLFNASLEGSTRRAIDIREGEKMNAPALSALVRAAAALNAEKTGKNQQSGGKVRLLSGGNPQVAKGEGEKPLRAYIAAMPGWKRKIGERLDALIVRAVPGIRRAVRWNSAFYGVDEGEWIASFHCFAKYVKVAFFKGASLTPLPPGESKQKNVRYLDIREEDEIDEERLVSWVRQATRIGGVRM